MLQSTADVAINFIFLFGIAIMPYAVQTFFRYGSDQNVLVLYFGDFALIFAALATLRLRALVQRRGDPDADMRLREWRGTVRQYTIVAVVTASLVGLVLGAFPREKFYTAVPAAFVVLTLVARVAVRRLPSFLH